MNEEHNSYGVRIERGVITHADVDGYTVKSYDRHGLVTPKINDIFGRQYSVGNHVYFFLSDDGGGKIICAIDKAIQEIKHPVSSVNKKTGAVELSAADVGALPSAGKAVDSAKFNGKTWTDMLAAVYPVGAIYISTSATSPALLFGGTWEQMKDRFLLGAGSTYTAGKTGGSASETLTIEQIPAHKHDMRLVNPEQNDGARSTSYIQYGYNGEANAVYTNANAMFDTGGSGSHNNMPPYVVVYMWKRVS